MAWFPGTRSIIPFVGALVLAFGSAAVQSKQLKVHLTGAEETPPVTSTASGEATLRIAKDGSVSGRIKTTGIDGTMAHVHVGAPGQSGPPIITLDKTADGVWSIPAGAKLTDDQLASYKAGNLYVNVHSAAHPPGEIRGQLKP